MSLDSRVRDDLRVAGEQMVDPPLNLAGVMRRGRRRKTVRLVASGLAAAALVTGAAVLLQRTDGQQPVVTDPTPTTGAVMPGNGWIVYQAGPVDEEPFGADLFIVRDGTAQRPLLGPESVGLKQICPVFSPDGTRLAYLEVVDPDTSTGDIVVADVDPAGAVVDSTRLQVAALPLDCPRWSPDGDLIAYSRVLQNARAFERQENGAPEPIAGLWVVTPSSDATNERRIVSSVLNDEEWPSQGFEWSPSGREMAVLLDNSVWLVPLDPEASPFELTSGFACDGRNCVSSVSWSPDGSRLAAAGAVAGGSCLLKVVEVDGSGETERPLPGCRVVQGVTGENVGLPLIAWSPDGRWIAYSKSETSAADDQPVIQLVSPDTEETLEFFNQGRYPVSGPTWSPDGTQILYWAGSGTTAGFELLSQTIAGDLPPVVLTSDPDPEQADPGSETTGTPAPTPARQISWQTVSS